MTQPRLSSGNARLDEILGGGLPRNGIDLIMGLPGTGKTILAQQYLFRNATVDRPGVYLSTISEPMEKILRYGQELDFFDPAMVGSSVFYEDLGAKLADTGLDGVLEAIDLLLRDRRPQFLSIDSFKALRVHAADDADFRLFLHGFAARVSAFPVSTFLVGEYGEEEIVTAPEFAVADAVIALRTERREHREIRVLQAHKLRGSDFASGSHAYRLSRDGLDVFPRLADPSDPTAYQVSHERIGTGVALFDEMIADGFWRGAATMVAGPTGSGKTLLGLHFVFSGVERGEPAVIATLQENPAQLARICAGYGWSTDHPSVDVMYRSPVDLHIDEWVYDLLERIERTGAKRVLIDSLGDIRIVAGDEIRFREYAYSLVQRAARLGVSLIMTQEVADLYGANRLAERGVSHLSDNVVLLQFVREPTELKRAITILKTRASAHDPAIRRFNITDAGFVLDRSESA